MSNSVLHQEKRLVRAKLKQKENRINRNAHAGGYRSINYPGPMTKFDLKVTKQSWWVHPIIRIRRFLRRKRAWLRNLTSH